MHGSEKVKKDTFDFINEKITEKTERNTTQKHYKLAYRSMLEYHFEK